MAEPINCKDCGATPATAETNDGRGHRFNIKCACGGSSKACATEQEAVTDWDARNSP